MSNKHNGFDTTYRNYVDSNFDGTFEEYKEKVGKQKNLNLKEE